MDVVVRDPKLLENIVGTEPVKHQTNGFSTYALVSKVWCEATLNVRWRKIGASDLLPLFRIFSPLNETKGSPETTSTRTPSLECWERFQHYARRVNVLNYAYIDFKINQRMDAGAYNSLALIQSRIPVFPNLHTFSVDASLPSAALFLHSDIRELQINLRAKQYTNIYDALAVGEHNQDFIHNVTLRVSQLTELSISFQNYCMMLDDLYAICPYEEEIVQLLSQQTNLRKLSFPRFWLTTKVINAISNLEFLQSVSDTAGDYYGHPLESVSFSPLTTQDHSNPALPSLRCLTLSVPYARFHSFLHRWVTPHVQFPTRLVQLHLRSQIIESTRALKELLQSISTCCPEIKNLEVSSVWPFTISASDPLHYGFDGGSAKIAEAPSEGWSLNSLLPFRVNLATIAPLFQLTRLRRLNLQHNLPAAFSSSDLEIIATNFRHLTHLDLFSNPCSVIRSTQPNVQCDEVILNLEDYADKYVFDLRTPLRVFGSLCPKLRSLGIFVYADPQVTEKQSYSIYPATYSAHQPPHTDRFFPQLRFLVFGSSPISGSATALAGILCEYIGQDVRISSTGFKTSRDCLSQAGIYTQRLTLGGKVPETIPDHEAKASQERMKPNIWNLDANGEPLGDDFAVVVTEQGQPLSLGLEFMQRDEEGVKRLPGVHSQRYDGMLKGVSYMLCARTRKWSKLDGLLAMAVMVFEQEKERVERSKY